MTTLEPAPCAETDELRSGSRWLMLATVAAGALNYGYALILLRLLQPADYATFAAGQALLLAIGAMAQCAVPWVLAHELCSARSDRMRRRAAVSFAVLANSAAGLVGALVVAAVASRFASGPAQLVIAVSVVAIFISNTTIGWLQGERRFGLLAIVVVAEVAVKILIGMALIAAGFGSGGALAGFGAGALFAVLFGIVCMRHDLRPLLAMEQLRRSLRTTVAMTSMQGLLAAQANVDVLLVAVLPIPLNEAAGYQAAAVLGRIPVFVSTGLSLVMFALVTEAPDRRDLLRRTRGAYALIAAFILAVLVTAPAELISIIIPARFTGSAALLPMLAVVGMWVGVVGLITAYLQALQQYRTAIPALAAGLLASAAAVAAGWRIGGPAGVAVGAALAAAATAIALQVLAHGSVRRWNPVPLRSLALPAMLVVVLLPLRAHPVAWVVAVTVAGAGCGYALLRGRRPAGTAGDDLAPTVLAASLPGPYLFVSPHLDDCVLSCGALLTALRGTHQVTVVTLFTAAAPGPVSLSARRYLRQCGARDAETLYRLRRDEDRAVLGRLGVEVVHLGLTEALFRRPQGMTRARRLASRCLPELGLTYPTYRCHVVAGKPARSDEAVVRRAGDEITALVASRRPATVFLPIGLGGHVDHVIARSVGKRFPSLAVYYADFPYSARHATDQQFIHRHNLVPTELREGLGDKQRLIRGYRSQFLPLFPNGTVPSIPERYFVPMRGQDDEAAVP